MMVVRLDVDPPALAAFDYGAMRIAVRDIDEKLRLAGAAAIGLVAAAFAQGASRDMRFDMHAFSVGFVNQDHVELRHGSPFLAGGLSYQRFVPCGSANEILDQHAFIRAVNALEVVLVVNERREAIIIVGEADIVARVGPL